MKKNTIKATCNVDKSKLPVVSYVKLGEIDDETAKELFYPQFLALKNHLDKRLIEAIKQEVTFRK